MKILIIEDEQIAAKRLEKLILEVDDSVEILAQLDSIETVLEWLAMNKMPDLIFLDIHLADGSAFEIFNRTTIDCPIIFSTAYDQYAIQAFKVDTIDYLLKPVKKEELKTALNKYKTIHNTNPFDYSELAKQLQKETSRRLKRFLIRVGPNIKTVDIQEVVYFYTAEKITFLITSQGNRYPIDFSLEKLEERLDSEVFFRINRQFVISLNAITKMVAVSKSRVKLYLKPCPVETIVSTERSGKFKKWLAGE